MLERLKIKVRGIAPLMMHNSQLVNPMNTWVLATKEITSKPAKKRTEADMSRLAFLEFMGGLYVDEDGEPCIPDSVIEGFFGAAARTLRKGKEGKAGISSLGNWPLIYDGPRDPEKMWASGSFRDTRPARVNNSKVIRTRPIFPKWSLEFEIIFDPEIIGRKDIEDILKAGAITHGFGDYIPKFGRFVVESITDLGEISFG